jgi:hypothetical protein
MPLVVVFEKQMGNRRYGADIQLVRLAFRLINSPMYLSYGNVVTMDI